MPSQFADVSSNFVSVPTLWRAARPVLVLLAAVGLAALVVTPDLRTRTAIIAGIVAGLLLVLWLIARLVLRNRPVLLVYLFEAEVGLIVLAILYVLTAVIVVMAEVVARYQDKTTAYLIGLVAGAAVGLFAKDILTPAKDEPWVPMHCRYRMNRQFGSYFYSYDDSGKAWITESPRKWSPQGEMSEALAANAYATSTGKWIDGWDHHARVVRARTLRAGLTAPKEATPP